MRRTPIGLDAKKVRSLVVFCNPRNNHPIVGMKTLGDLVVLHIFNVAHKHCIINKWFHVLHILTQSNDFGRIVGIHDANHSDVEEFIQGFEYDGFVSMAQD